MRRILVVLLVGTLLMSVAAPMSAAKKKKRKERTAEATYVGGAPTGGVDQSTPCVAECPRFEIKKGDRYVSLHLADASGQPVYASIYVNGYTDGGDAHEHACGETDIALPLRKGLTELVIVVEGSGGITAGCSGVPTSGTIHATFSNLP